MMKGEEDAVHAPLGGSASRSGGTNWNAGTCGTTLRMENDAKIRLSVSIDTEE